MRTVLKQLVRCAVLPSPIRRSVVLTELERCQTMLHWMMVMMKVEEAVGIKPIRGEMRAAFCSNRSFINHFVVSDCSNFGI